MKKYSGFKVLFSAVLFLSTIATHAQFVLTPSDGLVTSVKGYSIERHSTAEDNLQTAIKALQQVAPNIKINTDSIANNLFFAADIATIKMGKKGAKALDHKGLYTLKVTSSTDDITISFHDLAQFTHEKGSVLIPWKPVEKTILNFFIFKADGSVRHDKAKLAIEEWANNFIRNVEQAIVNLGN